MVSMWVHVTLGLEHEYVGYYIYKNYELQLLMPILMPLAFSG